MLPAPARPAYACPPSSPPRTPRLGAQSAQSAGVGGEQVLAEVLHMTKDIFGAVGDAMDAAVAAQEARQQQQQAALDGA